MAVTTKGLLETEMRFASEKWTFCEARDSKPLGCDKHEVAETLAIKVAAHKMITRVITMPMRYRRRLNVKEFMIEGNGVDFRWPASGRKRALRSNLGTLN